jgi:hypothetical protein
LTPIFLIGEEAAGCFRSLLLQTLEREHASVVGRIRKKRNGGIVFSYRSCPPQTFILWLFAGQGVLVHKHFGALAGHGLTLAKVKLVL